MATKRTKGRRTGLMPVMEFGSGRGALTLAIRKRGRVSLVGNGSFSPDAFADFLRKAAWYLDQLQQATADRGPVAVATTAEQMELFANDRSRT